MMSLLSLDILRSLGDSSKYKHPGQRSVMLFYQNAGGEYEDSILVLKRNQQSCSDYFCTGF